jgi:hypothetical protein
MIFMILIQLWIDWGTQPAEARAKQGHCLRQSPLVVSLDYDILFEASGAILFGKRKEPWKTCR